MTSPVSFEFYDWLDEVPRTPTGVLAYDRGETRVCPVSDVFAE